MGVGNVEKGGRRGWGRKRIRSFVPLGAAGPVSSKWKKSRGNQELGAPITGRGDPLTTTSAEKRQLHDVLYENEVSSNFVRTLYESEWLQWPQRTP